MATSLGTNPVSYSPVGFKKIDFLSKLEYFFFIYLLNIDTSFMWTFLKYCYNIWGGGSCQIVKFLDFIQEGKKVLSEPVLSINIISTNIFIVYGRTYHIFNPISSIIYLNQVQRVFGFWFLDCLFENIVECFSE